jgi:hypothetical protein
MPVHPAAAWHRRYPATAVSGLSPGIAPADGVSSPAPCLRSGSFVKIAASESETVGPSNNCFPVTIPQHDAEGQDTGPLVRFLSARLQPLVSRLPHFALAALAGKGDDLVRSEARGSGRGHYYLRW